MEDNKRFEFVRSNKLCFNCLKTRHMSTDCNSRSCYETRCNGKHNTALHGYFMKRAAREKNNDNGDNNSNKDNVKGQILARI